MKLISIVVPCYNESEAIFLSAERLFRILKSDHDIDFEYIFVNDGSSDDTYSKLLQIKKNSILKIKIINLSRNFGHQLAVTAGIDESSGDAIVLIDADLQDPPELIPDMIKKWQDGYDVVYGRRKVRYGESAFKLVTAKYFYEVLNKLSDVPIPLNTGDFRLMDSKVANQLKKMPEKHRFIRGMVSWVGFKQIGIDYEREPRIAGESKYPLKKMIAFALDGIISFSTKPLKISMYLGLSTALIAFIGIVYAVLLRIFTDSWVEGWTALIISILFIGGVQLVSIGILGEYVGRIYTEVKARPNYIKDSHD